MIFSDLHIHTNFCDGISSAEEMVLAAISRKMKCIGFSAHSYTSFDETYCIKKDRIEEYKEHINYLKKKYSDKIIILCGIEKDYYSDMPTSNFDYTIGSVHYIFKNGSYIPVDESPEILINTAKLEYGGDFISLAEDYFSLVADIINKTNADFIGHFDLISKFNDRHNLFDESNPRYISAYTAALNALLQQNRPFEVNTGGMARAGKFRPYPSPDMLKIIKQQGGCVLLSSDSHSPDTLCFKFKETISELKKIGFSEEELQSAADSIINNI